MGSDLELGWIEVFGGLGRGVASRFLALAISFVNVHVPIVRGVGSFSLSADSVVVFDLLIIGVSECSLGSLIEVAFELCDASP